MPVIIQCDGESGFPLTDGQVSEMWDGVRSRRNHKDETIVVRCVPEAEISRLNEKYRGGRGATNVLTFSYGNEHDVTLCLEVAEREAAEHNSGMSDYVGLLLVHAFLHATGLDHEKSAGDADKMKTIERRVLVDIGLVADTLV